MAYIPTQGEKIPEGTCSYSRQFFFFGGGGRGATLDHKQQEVAKRLPYLLKKANKQQKQPQHFNYFTTPPKTREYDDWHTASMILKVSWAFLQLVKFHYPTETTE